MASTPQQDRPTGIGFAEDPALLLALGSAIAEGPIPFALLDAGLRFTLVNASLDALRVLPADDDRAAALREVAPGFLAALLDSARRVLDTGMTFTGLELSGETAVRSGETRYFRVDCFPVRKDREVIGVGVFLEERTESRRLEEERERLIDQLAAATQSSAVFVGLLGHDLRNPLSAVVAGAQSLLAEAGSERIHRLSERVLRNGRRMERMIAEIIEYTRMRAAGGLTIVRSRLDLAALAGAVVDDVRSTHRSSVMELRKVGELAGDWDGERLTMALTGLLLHLVEHGPKGSPVGVDLDGRGAFVSVSLRSPVPSSEEALATLFDPNPTPEARLRRRGLELGPHIAKQIVLAHGGELTVRTSESEGLVFQLRLARRGSDGG